MADTDERDDGCSFHEIDVPALSAEQRPRAVAKRRRRAERDERVHIRAADFELPPRAAIKLCAGKNLHHAGQCEGQPLKPRIHAQAENPFTGHQRHRAEHPEPQIQVPAGLLVFAVIVSGGLNGFSLVAGISNRGDDAGHVGLGVPSPADGRTLRVEHHRCATHARHALEGFGHVPGAVAASHAAHQQFGDDCSRVVVGGMIRVCVIHTHRTVPHLTTGTEHSRMRTWRAICTWEK